MGMATHNDTDNAADALQRVAVQSDSRPGTRPFFRKHTDGGTACPSVYRPSCRRISVAVSRRRRRRHTPMRAARPAVDDHGCLSTSQQFLW